MLMRAVTLFLLFLNSTTNKAPYLSKIESNTEEIKFTLSSREDLSPGTTGN